jgi:REP element-mobilizing transposase RayT
LALAPFTGLLDFRLEPLVSTPSFSAEAKLREPPVNGGGKPPAATLPAVNGGPTTADAESPVNGAKDIRGIQDIQGFRGAISLAVPALIRDHCFMPRTARASVCGYCCHAFNRGNGRAQVFHEGEDYHGFVRLLRKACTRLPMRLVGFCLLPNHFHLVLWPRGDDDLNGTQVRAGTTTMAHYALDDLREAFASVMRKGTSYERKDVIQPIARYLRFARLTDPSRHALKSPIDNAIRHRLRGYDGSVIWREG